MKTRISNLVFTNDFIEFKFSSLIENSKIYGIGERRGNIIPDNLWWEHSQDKNYLTVRSLIMSGYF